METADVVIAGAGIVGLSLALELRARGLEVAVLERGRAMAESSWAAAGMLAGNDPELAAELAALAGFSLALYPEYLAGIEQRSGQKVPLRTKAAIQAVSGPEWAGRGAREISLGELLALEPDVRLDRGGLLLLDEASLDPRDLCAALPAAAAAAGVRLLEECAVVSVESRGASSGVAGGVEVRGAGTAVSAGHFVNCAGAWAESPALGRLPVGRPPLGRPRIAPRKGQMTTVRLRGRESLKHVVRTPEVYLVPRGDGRVTVGATVERAGFDKSVEARAVAGLLQAAAALFPPVAHAEIVESWAGLRPGFAPGSGDELPLIGPAGQPGCWVAGGHFRNGILLAPGTARALAQLMCGEAAEIDLGRFDPARSGAAQPRTPDRIVPAASDKRATAAL